MSVLSGQAALPGASSATSSQSLRCGLRSSSARWNWLETYGGGPAGVSECVIDLADARGTTLRIALKSPVLPDLAALSQVFWRARA